ncbi:hypothetical protein Nepgr_015267 [Nepenthes gracilis]|uniref:DUF7798 domain-containing protein n=1 Tax=Nepenthes gracilis TaxID=150966 RepID=A0AAD3XR52_NEPGR|nr:hypothetical protein Nepgr_015267 [Nepenthes gracilis]
MEDSQKSTEETEATAEERSVAAPPEPSSGSRPASGGGRGGWGGWGFTPLSYLSDLQKAAAVAAEEISRNAAAVAKSISERQNTADDSESTKEEYVEKSEIEEEDKDEMDKLRKSALDKLEKASEDSLLSQGLKVIDNSMENFASGAWQALGSALTGGSNFIQKLEHSAVNLAESLQHGGAGAVAPSLLETGKAFTAKGMQVLENVGKETMELLISETGIEVESNSNKADHQADDQLYEEMTFDRCFYIYGGPEQLQELEALSNHCALLFNRRKAKLSSELRSFYEGRLKAVQQILDLSTQTDAITAESKKGKKIETRSEGSDNELKSLHDSSISKAADMAAGFTSSLAGLSANDIIQRTAGRLESLHSEGVHRLSEICCFAVSQLLILGKSILSSANKTHQEESVEDLMNVEWPEDSLEKAKTIRTKAQSMAGSVEAVSNCFITGISDVAEAYIATIKGDSNEAPPDKSIQEKVSALSEHLRADQTTAVGKIQDGLQYLSFVVLSTSMRPS